MTISPSRKAPVSWFMSKSPFSPRGKLSTSVERSMFLCSLLSSCICSSFTKDTETSKSSLWPSYSNTAWQQRLTRSLMPTGIFTSVWLLVIITFTLPITFSHSFFVIFFISKDYVLHKLVTDNVLVGKSVY